LNFPVVCLLGAEALNVVLRLDRVSPYQLMSAVVVGIDVA